MKTLFIVSEKKVEDHVGEEYDYILEVEDQPTTDTIQETFDRVQTRIRSLWMDQTEAGDENPQIKCHLDAASPFNSMLLDLQVVMKDAEDIIIELPYLEGFEHVVHDREAQEKLRGLDGDSDNVSQTGGE